MPLVKFSTLVSGMKGVSNGSIFSELSGRFYFRNRVNFNRLGRARWQAQQAAFGNLSQQWRTLTPIQRAEWEALAPSYPFIDKFGDPYIGSGFQVFMSLNGTLTAAGEPILSVPFAPQTVFNPGPTTLTDLPAGILNVQWTDAIPIVGAVNVYAGCGVSAGRAFEEGKLKLMVTDKTVTSTGIDIGTEYQAEFGNPISGTKIWARVEALNIETGQSGNLQVADFIVP